VRYAELKLGCTLIASKAKDIESVNSIGEILRLCHLTLENPQVMVALGTTLTSEENPTTYSYR